MLAGQILQKHQQQKEQKKQQSRVRSSSYFSSRADRLLSRDEKENHDWKRTRKFSRPLKSSEPTCDQKQKQQQSGRLEDAKMDQIQRDETKEFKRRTLAAGPTLQAAQVDVGRKLPGATWRQFERAESQAKSEHSAEFEEQLADQSGLLEDGSQPTGSPQLATTTMAADGSKQHVGPVMGIFFKVWSLVKIAKTRQGKMQRQMSDDASGFHFISADQMPGSTSGGSSPIGADANSPPERRGQHNFGVVSGSHIMSKHLLHDSHFRRAGSQPPMSSHQQQQQHINQFEVMPSQNNSQFDHSGDRLQVHKLQLDVYQQQNNVQQQTISTTNSSSSGVSSTTSSTFATNDCSNNNTNNNPDPIQPNIIDQRQSPAGRKSGISIEQSSSMSGPRSWTSRIKGRATSSRQQKQQQASHEMPSRQNPTTVAAVAMINGGPNKTVRPAPSEWKQFSELKRRSSIVTEPSLLLQARVQQRQARFVRTPTATTMDENELDGGPSESFVDDDDSDLNDIYSTPNDSIQSVPSSQILHEQRRASSTAVGQAAAVTQRSQSLHPIVKSFSSQNFNLILHNQQQQQQQLSAANRRARRSSTIDEQVDQKSSSSSSSCKTTTNNIDGIASKSVDINRISEQHLSAKQQQQQQAIRNGSRFFISSSSSEDSQAAGHGGRQTNVGHSDQTSNSTSHENQHINVPIQLGLHYHEPNVSPAKRPNSLILTPPEVISFRNLRHQHLTPALNPSAILLNGTSSPSVAAMSPMFGPQQNNYVNHQQQIQTPVQLVASTNIQSTLHNSTSANYQKSPSLFGISDSRHQVDLDQTSQQVNLTSFSSKQKSFHHNLRSMQTKMNFSSDKQRSRLQIPNSISLHDCKSSTIEQQQKLLDKFKQSTGLLSNDNFEYQANLKLANISDETSEYKLAQMLLKLGSDPTAKDGDGNTALMLSIMSRNLAAFKCLIEHGVDLNITNNQGLTALDLICCRPASELLMEMFNLLIDKQVDFDRVRESDGTRLLDRLIGLQGADTLSLVEADWLPYIDCLLHNGAKLGSSTWLAASGKHTIQLRLLRKLCQDGYFLYKKSSIEAAVYRFEYALRRIGELEQQLTDSCCRSTFNRNKHNLESSPNFELIMRAIQQVKYQTYLGLSRCERKRKFYRRALEFAHMSILVDSTSYEGYYSKAHILKDIGEVDDALIAIDQTNRLVNKSIDHSKYALTKLQNQEESIIFEKCFQIYQPNKAFQIESKRLELNDTLEYLEEAKKHISRLRQDILEDKLRFNDCSNSVD